MASRRSFGQLRKLPSKRWQAGYVGPDTLTHRALSTFETKLDAEGWLTDERRIIASGGWVAPKDRGKIRAQIVTLTDYADTWLLERDLKPRTKDHYRRLLDRLIVPTLGSKPVKTITPVTVRTWHAELGGKTPTLRAHAYSLLRAVLASAVEDGLLPVNPCHIRGAGNSKRVHKIKPATLPELEALTAAMPDRYRLMVLLAAWCGLRFGELAELRRSDLDVKNGSIHIRRAVVRVNGAMVVGTPKSDAGVRNVAIPPHLMPVVKSHLAEHIDFGRDALLFPAASGGHLAPSTLYRVFYPARDAAGRPDLRWHDLRHTGATLAAATGATLAELMGRLGHSTTTAAMRYQHAAQDRDTAIARALSAMVEAN